MEQSIYSPLKEGEIRLVRLITSQRSSQETDGTRRNRTLCLEMKTFKLSTSPRYEALSYCWTQEQASCSVCLNKRRLSIRPNLHAYLDVRQRERPKATQVAKIYGGPWIFIDALCINQDDTAEKADQISIMGEIYYGAHNVIAWLGTQLDDGADLLPSEHCSTSGLSKKPTDPYSSWSAKRKTELEMKVMTEMKNTTLLGELRLSEGRCQVVKNMFLHRSYWTRIWIVQELVLAHRLSFKFRDLEVTIWQFIALINHLKDHEGLGRRSIQGRLFEHIGRDLQALLVARKVIQMTHISGPPRVLRGDSEAPTILYTITNWSGQECTEPYDHVFGILGLTNSALRPDYDMPKLELFLRVLTEGFFLTLEIFPEDIILPEQDNRRSTRKLLFTRNLVCGLDLDLPEFMTTLIIYYVLFWLHEVSGVKCEPITNFLLRVVEVKVIAEGKPDKSQDETARMVATFRTIETHLQHPKLSLPPYGAEPSQSLCDWVFVAYGIMRETIRNIRVPKELLGFHRSFDSEAMQKASDRFLELKKL